MSSENISANKPKNLQLGKDDIDFFIQESQRAPKVDKTILITGEYDSAQRALFNLLDTGSKIKEINLMNEHRGNFDERKKKIEESLRSEGISETDWQRKNSDIRFEDNDDVFLSLAVDQSIMSIDLRITEFADNEKKVNEILKPVFQKQLTTVPFESIDFTKKDFMVEDYPIESRKHLTQTEFYCKKAREYATKREDMQKTVKFYSNKSKEYKSSSNQISHQYAKLAKDFIKIATDYDNIFHYCIQEAVVWKKAAEIWKSGAQDKKKISDPKRASRCIIPMEGNNIEYVYIPTDKRLIDQASIELEVLKAGFLQRNGLDATALTVKNINSFKKNTDVIKNMYDLLNVYGGDFNDRGMVLITDRKKSSTRKGTLIQGNNDQLIENEIVTDLGNEDKKCIDNILDSDTCPELFFEIMEKIEDRCFWVDKVAIDDKQDRDSPTMKDTNTQNDFAKFNTMKMIDSIREVQNITEGKKHISNVMQIGKVIYEKISNNIDTKNEIEVPIIDKALIQNVVAEEVKKATVAIRYEKKEIDSRVENNRKFIDAKPKMTTQVRRERRYARKIEKERNFTNKINAKCEILQVSDEKIVDDKQVLEISNQIKRAKETLSNIKEITEQWLDQDESRENINFAKINISYTQIIDKKRRLEKEHKLCIENNKDRCLVENLKQIQIEYDILMLECGNIGNLMNIQFFFSSALNSMDSIRHL